MRLLKTYIEKVFTISTNKSVNIDKSSKIVCYILENKVVSPFPRIDVYPFPYQKTILDATVVDDFWKHCGKDEIYSRLLKTYTVLKRYLHYIQIKV